MSERKKPTTGLGEGMDALLQRSLEHYGTLGEPGPAMPWIEDEHGDWFRMLAGSCRIVALVDKYPEDLGDGYFYCVGDGPAEESSEEHFGSIEEARAAADARLLEMGYTFAGAN